MLAKLLVIASNKTMNYSKKSKVYIFLTVLVVLVSVFYIKFYKKDINEQLGDAKIEDVIVNDILPGEEAKLINKEDCLNSENKTEKNECLTNFFVERSGVENDPRKCLLAEDYLIRNDCILNFAKRELNFPLCKRIALKEFRQRCEDEVGTILQGADYCERFSDEPNERQECVDRYNAFEVGKNGKIEDCENIKTLEYGFLCEVEAMKTSRFGCEVMKDEDIRELCESRVQYTTAKSEDDCNRIKEGTYKKVCLAIFANAKNPNYNFDDDNDGLNNAKELWITTDPFNSDTDGDGLNDFDEYNSYKTNPTSADTDGDGSSDFEEIIKKTDPENPNNSDKKEVTNTDNWWEEYKQADILDNSWKKDSDSDGLIDVDEVFYFTNPFSPDTDNDGINDEKEINESANPLGEGSIDNDGDGLTDEDEKKLLSNVFLSDTNNDGVNDGDALQRSLSVTGDDSDSDGLNNLFEKKIGTDLFNTDSDNDGLTDGKEVNSYYSDPLNKDSDNDGFSDADEIKNGFNPNGQGKLIIE